MAELTAEQAVAHHGGHDEAAQNENRKFGMWLYLTSEVVIFAMLIAGYVVFRATESNAINIVKDSLGIWLVSANTFILLASSYAMVLGLRAIQKGSRRGFYLGIGATAILGAAFLGGQYIEYSELGHLQITLEKNDFTVATTVFESINEVEAEVSATITDADGTVVGSSSEMVHIREVHDFSAEGDRHMLEKARSLFRAAFPHEPEAIERIVRMMGKRAALDFEPGASEPARAISPEGYDRFRNILQQFHGAS